MIKGGKNPVYIESKAMWWLQMKHIAFLGLWIFWISFIISLNICGRSRSNSFLNKTSLMKYSIFWQRIV